MLPNGAVLFHQLMGETKALLCERTQYLCETCQV